MEQCNSLLWNITIEPVIVAVELGVDIIGKSPETIAKLASLPEIQKIIKKTVSVEGNRLLSEQRKGNAVSNDNAPEILNNLKQKGIKNTEDAAMHEFMESVDYKQAKTYLNNLKCSFNKSSMGIFINKNQKLLIIVGTIMAVGGVSYLYVSRQGDKPVDWALDLTKSHFRGKLTGSLEGGISDIKFVPSTRNVVVKGYLKGDFKGVAYKFDLRFASLEDKVVGVGAGTSLSVPLKKDINLSASVKTDLDRQLNDKGNLTKFSGIYQVGLGLNIKNVGGAPGLNLNIQATSQNNKLIPGIKTPMVEHKMLVGASWDF